MAKRSRGWRSGTRKKIQKKKRDRGKLPISRILRTFDVGEMVHIVVEPSVHKGMPHHRFHGSTGKILARRGRAYLVEVRVGNAKKQVFALPAHLKPQKG